MAGYTPQELIGRHLHDTIHYARADGTPCSWEECPTREALLDGRPHRATDEVFWRKDGTPLPVEFDIGLPAHDTMYGCQMEGILLALDAELPCSWGRGNITPEKLSLFLAKLGPDRGLDVAYSIGNQMYSPEALEQYGSRLTRKPGALAC